MTKTLVTGGTGHLGRQLVPRLQAKGHDVRVLSRRERSDVQAGVEAVQGDLATGDGIAAALEGADVIVHCASGTGTARGLTYASAKRTDVDATKRMLDLTKGASRPHVVYISIVGIDRIPLGYYRAKLDTERVIEASGLPFTILRTTQWHTLAAEFCGRLTRLPIVLAPKGARMQLLDPSEVADRMVTLVEAGPSGHVAEMGGPEALDLVDVLRSYVGAIKKKRVIRSVRFPGKTLRAISEGHNLTPDHRDGTITWGRWLRSNVAT